MVKIGVISDNHGNYEYIRKALIEMGEIQYLFHLGDFLGKKTDLEKMTDANLYIILGNMDYRVSDGVDEVFTTIGDKRIFACHGHQYQVKYHLNNLLYIGQEKRADIVLFGHTHEPYLEETEGVLLMNPGSVRYPKGINRPSCGLITIKDNRAIGKIIYLDDVKTK